MISAIVIAKNEEKNISECLKSLLWCDEVILIDDNSTDKTVQIAEKLKVKVYIRSLQNKFSDQRNFGLKQAKGDWVLFIDADERVTPALWYEIMQHTNSSIENIDGFYIKRTDFIWGKKLKHGETGNIKFLRLAKKNSGKWTGAVHESLKINGKTAFLNNELLHYPHTSISDFLKEINYYTDLRAQELFSNKKVVSSAGVIYYPFGKFVINYLIKLGFLDGVPGLVFALMMSFHSFLVRGKLWILNNKGKDSR
jgi:glycosyltransferase involved in cell wall biosynthesis